MEYKPSILRFAIAGGIALSLLFTLCWLGTMVWLGAFSPPFHCTLHGSANCMDHSFGTGGLQRTIFRVLHGRHSGMELQFGRLDRDQIKVARCYRRRCNSCTETLRSITPHGKMGANLNTYAAHRTRWSADEQHPRGHIIMLDKAVIQRRSHMKDDETQQYINKYVVNVSRLMAPFRSIGSQLW